MVAMLGNTLVRCALGRCGKPQDVCPRKSFIRYIGRCAWKYSRSLRPLVIGLFLEILQIAVRLKILYVAHGVWKCS